MREQLLSSLQVSEEDVGRLLTLCLLRCSQIFQSSEVVSWHPCRGTQTCFSVQMAWPNCLSFSSTAGSEKSSILRRGRTDAAATPKPQKSRPQKIRSQEDAAALPRWPGTSELDRCTKKQSAVEKFEQRAAFTCFQLQWVHSF